MRKTITLELDDRWEPGWCDSAAFWNKEEHKKYFASLDEENKEEEE